MPEQYAIRYGVMGRVGRFAADVPLDRGQRVVVRSPRGTELGEVLAPTAGPPTSALVLRPAGPEDLERARRAELDRPRRLDACERVFRDGLWPLEILDVEALLDDDRTVVHYLGAHHLDADGLIDALRDRLGLHILLEPAGLDTPDDEPTAAEHACGSCSSGGCGTGGGCSGCAVKDLIARRPA